MRAVASLLLVLAVAVPAASAKPGHGTPTLEAPERSALGCGSSGCVRGGGADALPLGGPLEREAPPPSPYYTLAFERETLGGELEAYTVLYVPAVDAVAANEVRPGELTWFPVFGPGREAARRAVRDVEPFPAPEAWPAELKSPGRLLAGSVEGRTAAPDRRVAGGLLVALACACAAALGGRRRRAAARS